MSRALLALGDVIGISTLTGAVKADDLELEVIRGFGVCAMKESTNDDDGMAEGALWDNLFTVVVYEEASGRPKELLPDFTILPEPDLLDTDPPPGRFEVLGTVNESIIFAVEVEAIGWTGATTSSSSLWLTVEIFAASRAQLSKVQERLVSHG